MTYSEPYPTGGDANRGGATPGPVAGIPRFVNIAFYLFLLVALTRVISIIISITQIGNVTDEAKKQIADQTSNSSVSQSQLEGVLRGTIIAGIVISVLFVIAFVLFDYLMRRGANWARWVLAVLTLLSLSGVASAYGVGAVGVVAGIVATILMFLRPSNEYFRAVKERKLAVKGGGYGGNYPPQQPPAQQ